MSQAKLSSTPLQWGDTVDEECQDSSMLTFVSNNKSHEEPTNRAENLTSRSENDLLEKNQSQATAAAATLHSKDVQRVQDRPKASATRQVKWKFPISATDDASYRSEDSKNKQINYLNHQVDVIKSKLLKKNFFLTRETDRRVAAEEQLKTVENTLTCERNHRLKCQHELKNRNQIILEYCLSTKATKTQHESVVKELKEQLQEKTASNIQLASKVTTQEEAIKELEKKVADLTKSSIPSNNQPEVIQEPQDTEEVSPPIIVQGPENISEPEDDEETKMDSEDIQEVIPLDLTQQTGAPQPEMVPELLSYVEMELVQEAKDVSEPTKENVSSKKTEEPTATNNQPEVIQEPQDTEEMSPPIEKISVPAEEKETEIVPNEFQEEIVIKMEPVSKDAEDFQPPDHLNATEDVSQEQEPKQEDVDIIAGETQESIPIETLFPVESPQEERPEVISLWRRFKKYVTPKHLRKYKSKKIKRENNCSI